MQTLFIIYHEDLEAQVRAIVHRGMVVARYTRLDDVVGARMVEMEEQTGYMTDRRNRIIMLMANKEVVEKIVADLQEVRKREGHGLRGFVVDASVVF